MRDGLFFFVWLVLLPISFYSAHVGVLLWIWVALMSPNDLLYGVMAGVPFNKIVAASTIGMMIFGKEPKRFYADTMIVLILAFGLIVTLSYLTMEHPGGFADVQYDKLWKEVTLAILVTGIMTTRHRLHQMLLVISLSYGFIMAREGLIFLFTAGGHQVNGNGSTGDNNGLALAVLMTLPMALYVAKYSAVRWVRLAVQATAGLGLVTVIATFSRGGFVGLIAMTLMLLRGSRYKMRTILGLALAAPLLWMVAPESWVERISTIQEASQDSSFMTRVVAWKLNFMLALDHPLLGNGPYASLSWENWTKHLQESTTWLFPTPLVDQTFVAHSIYFQVLGDTGFLGLFVFVSILVTAFTLLRRTRRITRNDPSLTWANDLARALEASMVVYCVAGAALSLVYFELLFMTLAMVSRVHRTASELTAVQRLAARGAAAARVAGPVRPGMRPLPTRPQGTFG